MENNNLVLDGFFITDTANKYRDQAIEITIYLPEGTVVYADENTSSYYESSNYDEWIDWNNDAHYLKVSKNKVKCLDCNEMEESIR